MIYVFVCPKKWSVNIRLLFLKEESLFEKKIQNLFCENGRFLKYINFDAKITTMVISEDTKMIQFMKPVQATHIPDHFPSPFSEVPHPLAQKAANQLRVFLETDVYWENIPLYPDLKAHNRIGKMFGVLVVRDQKGDLGFLAAFSGKLLGENSYKHFVPPVFDMLEEDGFYVKEEQILLELSRQIKEVECSEEYQHSLQQFNEKKKSIEAEWKTIRLEHIRAKSERNALKENIRTNLSGINLAVEEERINKASVSATYQFKRAKLEYKQRLIQAEEGLNRLKHTISHLKTERKERSKVLQQKLYEQYQFLNGDHELKDLKAIFPNYKVPPSGSGECAAPKLLHHAFKYNLTPLCMAEFWWGRSPGANQKTEGDFYPPCDEKCKPILKHMLKGL